MFMVMYSFQECVDNMYSSICEWLYIERLITDADISNKECISP